MKKKSFLLATIGLLSTLSVLADNPETQDKNAPYEIIVYESNNIESKNYDFRLSLNDESINTIFSSLKYPKFLFKILGRINIDPLQTKSEELLRESEISITPELLSDAISSKELAKKILYDLQSNTNKSGLPNEISELKKLSESDIETYLKSGVLSLRSMEIFRFEVFLNSCPKLTFDNNSIELKDIELKLIYNIRIHYKVGCIKSHIDFNTSGQKLQSTIKLNSIKRGKKLYINPHIERLKLVFKVAGFKVTLNMLDYFTPDLEEMELVDIDKLVLSIPSINTNVAVKEFDLIIDEHNLGIGISFGFQ